jgi:LysM repeat protein
MIHTVAPGDTLFGISRKYSITTDQLLALNNLPAGTALRIGQQLRVAAPPATSSPTNATYTVKPGDTLYGVAARFKISPQALQTANRLTTASLSVGQVLVIPSASGSINPPISTPVQPPATVNVTGGVTGARSMIRVGVTNFSFPHPTTGAMVNTPNFRAVNAGIAYGGGNSPANLGLDSFMKAGLSNAQAQMLKEVSKHEGCFDAINTWDRAIFSFGFIQLAGAVTGSRLPALMTNIKTKEPNLFNELFRKFGIDVNNNVISVIDDNGNTQTDTNAYMALQRSRQLCGIWVRAGYHQRVAELQIEAAAQYYLVPALTKIRINLAVGGTIIPSVPITDIIRSVAGQATLVDITVNQWINTTGTYFKHAIEKVAKNSGLNSLDRVRNIDERAVLQEIVNLASYYAKNPSTTEAAFQRPDACQRVIKRAGSMITSGLSFAK